MSAKRGLMIHLPRLGIRCEVRFGQPLVVTFVTLGFLLACKLVEELDHQIAAAMAQLLADGRYLAAHQESLSERADTIFATDLAWTGGAVDIDAGRRH